MTVSFFINTSEPNKIDKSLSPAEPGTITGTLRERCSITAPSIMFEGNISQFARTNYFYIPAFERYYYITDVVSEYADKVRVTGKVDVLQTYAGSIKAMRGIVARSANKYNTLLQDNAFKVESDPTIVTKTFSNSMTDENIILVLTGV